MPGEVKRAVRVAERVREELSMLLAHEVRDPRVVGVVVARVEMTDDLRTVRAYVRLLEGGSEARQKELIVGLGKAAGLLRREVTQRLALRSAPEFKFFYDEGQDALTRIEVLLEEVKKDERKRPKD